MHDDPADALTAAASGPASDAARPFRAGDLVAGRFRIVRAIAEGGMGVVYEAIDEKLGERRALKCAKPGYAGRLPPEARHSLRVTHPNVCRVFEIHTTDTPLGAVDFISMEYLDGGTLSREIRARGPLPESEARRIAVQLCAGVAAAHAQKVLHRDLKSNNVMLTGGAGQRRAVVTDFGLAQESHARGPAPPWSGAAGTPAYLAPERWQGAPATIQSDIYALGVVLHEMIAGTLPAPAPGFARAIDTGVPARWRTVIARCLEPDPGKRYTSVDAVSDALTNRRARTRAIAAGAAAALVAAILVGYRVLVPAPIPARLAVFPFEAADADPGTATQVRGLSSDMSSRLTRMRPRPRQLVIIPVDETRLLDPRDTAQAKDRLGATHVLRATVARRGDRSFVRAVVVDTSTKVTFAESSSDYPAGDAAAIVPALAAFVSSAFRLPRQTAGDGINPKAYAAYADGVAALQDGPGSYVQAIAAFEKAIAADPRSVMPRAGLVEAYYDAWVATNDETWLDRGRDALAAARAIDPDSLATHLAGGHLHLVPGGYADAAREYQRATEIDPASPEAWNGLGRAYEEMADHHNDAAAAYLKAIELQPGYFRPVNNLGAFYRRIGNLPEAEAQWSKGIAMAPRRFEGHVNLAALFLDTGRYAEAEQALKQALDIQPRSRGVFNNLGVLYQFTRRDDQAVSAFEQARAIGPESHTLLVNLGDSYRRLGRERDAAAAYLRARELADAIVLKDPADAVTRATVAYLAFRLGDTATAHRELVQALNSAGADLVVIRRAVLCLEAMGARDRALALLQSAPSDFVRDLSRHPDLNLLRDDARFAALAHDAQPR